MKSNAFSDPGAGLGAGLMPLSSHAWWNGDFKHRTRSPSTPRLKGWKPRETLSGVVVPVRLHSGNFDFLAKPDGSDIRVVGADDKAPLKFWVERFDAAMNWLCCGCKCPAWRRAPTKNHVFVYAGNEKAAAEIPARPCLMAPCWQPSP